MKTPSPHLPPIQIVSKIACISGCSRGLGRAMAQEFSARGWKIAGGARNIKELESLKSQLFKVFSSV